VAGRLISLASALVLVAGCASGAPVAPTPAASPSRSVEASTTAASPGPSAAAYACSDETLGCAGSLTAGTHHTTNFERPFSFTVGAGWTNDRDIYRAYILQNSAAPDEEFIVWTRSAPAQQTPDCSPSRRPGYGTSVAEWLRSLQHDDRLGVTEIETFDLGSHPATRVKVSTKPGFAAVCPFNSDPFAVIVTDTEIPPTRHHGGTGAWLTFVDFGTDSVLIWNDGLRMPELALPVIKSMRFDD
jgi:hypothetical protein